MVSARCAPGRRGGGGSAGRWTIILRARWLPGRSPGAGRTISGGASAGRGGRRARRGGQGREGGGGVGRGRGGEAAGVLLGGAQGGVGVGAVHAAGREVVDEGAGVVVVRAGPVVGGDADLGEEGEAKGGVEVEEGGGEGRPGVEVEGLGRRGVVVVRFLVVHGLRAPPVPSRAGSGSTSTARSFGRTCARNHANGCVRR